MLMVIRRGIFKVYMPQIPPANDSHGSSDFKADFCLEE